ncbi:MAG: hypothetical protein SGARI_005675, partial [Bacillariaceae sp.]
KPNKKKTKSAEVDVSPGGSGAKSGLERHLGNKLLVNGSLPAKPTAELMKGKKLVGLYFTSSNPLGKEFTPKLAEFYKTCQDQKEIEIVFVSSDDDRKSFRDTFSDMPWLAIDGDKDGARVKHNLATHLKVFRLPSLIILNVETGNFVTDFARKQVLELFDTNESGKEALNVQRGKALIKTWETQEPEQIGHADTFANTLYLTAMHFKKRPFYVVGLIVFLFYTDTIRRVQSNPLLGMAMMYLLLKLGKEPLDKNIPYIEQPEIQEAESPTATNGHEKEEKAATAKKNE